MAPGILDHPGIATIESRPLKRIKTSVATETENDDDDVAAAVTAVPSHPLGIKPAGNAYTASENIKARCGLFASLPDELLSHILESFEANVLVRLGSTCRALYAFTRLDELWRALFVRLVPPSRYTISPMLHPFSCPVIALISSHLLVTYSVRRLIRRRPFLVSSWPSMTVPARLIIPRVSRCRILNKCGIIQSVYPISFRNEAVYLSLVSNLYCIVLYVQNPDTGNEFSLAR
jgi:hypothetical protein